MVEKLTAEGSLPHYKFGRAVRYRIGEIEAWAVAHRKGDISPTSV
jgi:hypothetical protein